LSGNHDNQFAELDGHNYLSPGYVRKVND